MVIVFWVVVVVLGGEISLNVKLSHVPLYFKLLLNYKFASEVGSTRKWHSASKYPPADFCYIISLLVYIQST